MPGKRPSVKNEKQYEKLKAKWMSKERAAKLLPEQPTAGRRDRSEESRGLQGRARDRAELVETGTGASDEAPVPLDL